jgi:malonate-semialdehyde dehydrogenase (acetylating)/methylmalonate-semialdehyde dehydrogenase
MTTTPTTTRLLDNYVGGRWTPSSSQEALPVTNPATGETLARVPLSSADDLDAAVRAAREALPVWRGVSVIERGRRLFALREVPRGPPQTLKMDDTRQFPVAAEPALADRKERKPSCTERASPPTLLRGEALSVSGGTQWTH